MKTEEKKKIIFHAESFLKDREDTLYFFFVHCH